MTQLHEEVRPIAPALKKTWGDGAWLREPDRVEWEHAGLACLMVRHEDSGHWCGYAAVPPGHPLHGHDYSRLYALLPESDELTYGRGCMGQICHVPKLGEPDNVWWLGFDCAHHMDYSPGMEARMRQFRYERGEPSARPWTYGQSYKTATYVRERTEVLAEELAEVGRRWHSRTRGRHDRAQIIAMMIRDYDEPEEQQAFLARIAVTA